MPESKKIVFLDIDGTLADRRNRVPLSARNACRRARENGHLLYIATGRTRRQINESILALGFDGIISSGGACIESGEQLVFSAFLPPSLLERLLGYFNSRKAGYLLELPERIITSPAFFFQFESIAFPLKRLPRASALWSFGNLLRNHIALPGEYFNREKVYKLVFLESEHLRFEDVKQNFGDDCEIFRNSVPLSVKGGGEITPRGIHKGSAAEWVTRFHSMDRKDTIAIGDSDNDRTMLEYAGLGIAMGNGNESLKKIAGDITGRVNRGGLSKAFVKYGLA
ncbi:MAG: HAD family hydrolase [Treponema sp.]|jgi:Cof subfamily protein (haloacid dehalogenase superfamily)|nr:HAD family hydrolase [Treponema sp.]